MQKPSSRNGTRVANTFPEPTDERDITTQGVERVVTRTLSTKQSFGSSISRGPFGKSGMPVDALIALCVARVARSRAGGIIGNHVLQPRSQLRGDACYSGIGEPVGVVDTDLGGVACDVSVARTF